MKSYQAGALLAAGAVCGFGGLALRHLAPGMLPDMATGALVGLGLGLVFAALLRWRLGDGCDAAPAPVRRRYTRALLIAMGAYVVVLMASITLIKTTELAPALRAAVALAPVLPIAFVLGAMAQYIRQTDEMQQRIELEAVSLATAFVCLLYMAGGFLQTAKVIDLPAAVPLIWAFPLVCFSYGLAKTYVVTRYR